MSLLHISHVLYVRARVIQVRNRGMATVGCDKWDHRDEKAPREGRPENI